MKNFSKYALTSITALTVASPFVTMDGYAKDKSVKQDIDAKVTQQTDAPKALKALPGSENVKNHYKDYVVTDVKRQQKNMKDDAVIKDNDKTKMFNVELITTTQV